MELNPIQLNQLNFEAKSLIKVKDEPKSSGKSFANLVENSFNNLKEINNQLDVAIEQYASGDSPDPTQVLLTMSRAKMGNEYFIRVRNGLIEGYKEIKNIQM